MNVHLFTTHPSAFELLAMFPPEDRVVGMVVPHNRRTSSKVAEVVKMAEKRGIPVVEQPTRRPIPHGLPPAEAGVSWMYAQVIIDEDIPRYPRGILNNHFGRIPEYRGFHTPQWAIVQGESEVGVTWHEVTSIVDGGLIWMESRVPVDEDMTALVARDLAVREGVRSFAEAWRRFRSRQGHVRMPDVTQGRWWPPRGEDDARIGAGLTLRQLKDQIRACCPPWPPAFVQAAAGAIPVAGVSTAEIPGSVPYQTADHGVVYLRRSADR